MDFFNQTWFWTGAFTLVGTLTATIVKEYFSSKSLIKIERIKLYDSEKFKAYNSLYQFISAAYIYLSPFDDRRVGFIQLMKNEFFQNVKSNYLYYDSEIRKILKMFETQYDCLREPDFIPPIEHKLFLNEKIGEMLNSLETKVEKMTDKLL